MKTKNIMFAGMLLILPALYCGQMNAQSQTNMIKEENVTYSAGGVRLNGFIAYDQTIKGKRPAILVVHEWWGLNDYIRMRARKLAALGYIAMAVDIFGEGRTASTPQEAQDLTKPFYQDPGLAKKRLDAAIIKIKENPLTDQSNIAAIGYCFGGGVLLNSAKLGSDLKGVVSFHGGLSGPPADKALLKAKILVCHGGNDRFVSQKDIDTFRHQLDSAGADYSFRVYANATHAFTNPDATVTGKKFNMPIEYNAEADKNSWNDMKDFLKNLFGR
ncbi:MAG TPA: dienelactone hydrolase family protein [Bacteroidales bacterium]|nr:dienelactone hydrolase family protein [Bacteroidales bacterium]